MTVSQTEQIRKIAQEMTLAGLEVTSASIGERCGAQTYRDRMLISKLLFDLYRRGDLRRVRTGVYAHVPRENFKPQKQEVMWRFLRIERIVTAADLQEVAGVTADYAAEWLQFLVRHKVVRACGSGRYQLVSDALDMPINHEKAARLKEVRARRRSEAEASTAGAGG